MKYVAYVQIILKAHLKESGTEGKVFHQEVET